MLLQRFERNTQGKDYAVGDIHGMFSFLSDELKRIKFVPENGDRLFCVGDLIDRGPESELVVDWLRLPWFHSVRGNHDDYAIRYKTVDRANWIYNGGAWFMGLPEAQQAEISVALSQLPLAIEVMTAYGPVGIVHADFPPEWSWSTFVTTVSGPGLLTQAQRKQLAGKLMWSRTRSLDQDSSGVRGCRALVVGHEIVPEVTTLGNVIYIETGAQRLTGHFTILDLDALKPAVTA